MANNTAKKTRLVMIRMTEEERESLQERAEMTGMTMSELIRRSYFGKPIVSKADLRMIREVSRLGGLLKHIHNQSKGAYSKDTAQAIQTLRQYIEKLSDDS